MCRSWVDPGAAQKLALCCLAAAGLAACGPTDGHAGSGSPSAPATTATDWRDATYTLTCDGIVPDGFPAELRKGRARVPADAGQTPY